MKFIVYDAIGDKDRPTACVKVTEALHRGQQSSVTETTEPMVVCSEDLRCFGAQT